MHRYSHSQRRVACSGIVTSATQSSPRGHWRDKAKPIESGSMYPAKENCSSCGLCDTYFISHVKEACAFLGDSNIMSLEERVHGRQRDLDDPNEVLFGVIDETFNARVQPPIEGAQWTGVVTGIAVEMLRQGKVDAVVCVQSEEGDEFAPRPFVATCVEDIIAAKGVKPCLSPNLNVLATVEALDVRRLLFIGVGCQVEALRGIQPYLHVDDVYVIGLNCTDNGERESLDKFLNAASEDPDTVTNYEFMADYRVHLRHRDGHYEKIPYFCLPARELSDVIAPSCLSCFQYPNDLADLTVGYMKAPYDSTTPMNEHFQSMIVRNERGRELIDAIRSVSQLESQPPSGRAGVLKRQSLVVQTVVADDEAKCGQGPTEGAPRWLGEVLAWVLTGLGPTGIEFAKYSIEYHYLRNYIHVMRHWNGKAAEKHIPEYVNRIVKYYDEKTGGLISKRASLPAPFPGAKIKVKK